MDTITTRTVGTGFAEIGESVLTETTQTAIVFKPQMHEGGIRGSIIRYKKGRNGDRETPVPVDFRRLNAGDGIEIELNTEAVTNLTQRIQEIQAFPPGRSESRTPFSQGSWDGSRDPAGRCCRSTAPR